MVIGIDVGYGITKAYAGMQDDKALVTSFPSVYLATDTPFKENQRGDYAHIKLDGQNYFLGKYAVIKNGENTFDKNDMLRHKLCILTAIARVFPENVTCDVALGLPIGDMILADNFKKLAGQYDFVYNGKKRKVNIASVNVYPQGVAVFDELAEYEDVESSVIGIVDIGQKTIDVAWYADGIEVDNRSRSYDTLGCSFVYQQIVKAVNAKLGYEIPDYQVADRIIKRPEIAEIAEPYFKDFAEKIETELRRLSWNYNELDKLVLVGGGAFYVEKYLKKSIKCVELHQNAAYANACGFYAKAGGN